MIKIGKTLRNFVFTSVLLAGIVSPANTVVFSESDKKQVGVGESFTVSVNVVSSEDVEIQEPRLPEIEGFELLGSHASSQIAQKLVQTSSGMQFETQRKKIFNYQFRALRQGNLSLDSFEVVVEGKVYRTSPVLIQVLADAPQAQQAPPSRGRPAMPGFDDENDPFAAMDRMEEDLFNQLLQQRQRMFGQQQAPAPGADPQSSVGAEIPDAAFRSLPTNPNEAFFIAVEVDKTEVYEGEQITVNWYLYTRGQMETLDRVKFPNLKGFWKEIIAEVPSIQFYQEVVNGVPWKKALLASHALFPIKAGTATIDEYRIKSRVRSVTTMGLGRPYEYTKTSARVPIKVKALPAEGRPREFTGAVGKFDISTNVENKSIPVNQPLTLKVRFEGAGNAKVIELPAMELPPGLEQYETKSESRFFKNGRSFKEFEVLLIPRQEGDLTIPGLSVAMFDPQTSRYYTRTTDPIELKVVPNPNASVGAASRLAVDSPPTKPPQKQDLPPPILQLEASSQPFVSVVWLWVMGYAVALLTLLAQAQKVFGWGLKKKSLRDQLAIRLKKVDAAYKKSEHRKLGTEMTNAFYLVFGEVSGEAGAGEVLQLLLNKLSPSLRTKYGPLISQSFEYFQTLTFAPEEMIKPLVQKERLQTEVSKAKKLLNSVVSEIELK